MAQRLTFNSITPKTEDWTCKVQVVDKHPPKTNRCGTKMCQLLLLQDEEENQVQAIMWNIDIIHYEKYLKLFHTYLVSVAQVKELPERYATLFSRYTWTIDRTTIVEPIEKVVPPENPLPAPTRLTVIPFDAFDQQVPNSEFDVLALLINAALPTYTTYGKRIQEFIIMDAKKKPKKLTLWDGFVEYYGRTLSKMFKDYPVILIKRVGKSSSGLSNRYNTTILFDPTYSEAVTLGAWAKTNQQMLIEYTIKSTSETGSLLFVPFEEEPISISDIQMQPPSGQIFYIDAQITITNKDQHFCSMICSDCEASFISSTSSRPIYCTHCEQNTRLIPRVQFEVTITDHTGSATAFISGQVAEKMLRLTTQEIYEIYRAKQQSLLPQQLQEDLETINYKIQMKKQFSRNQDTTTAVAKLIIVNYEGKTNGHQPLPPTVPMAITEANKRKVVDINTKSIAQHDLSTKNRGKLKVETTHPQRKSKSLWINFC